MKHYEFTNITSVILSKLNHKTFLTRHSLWQAFFNLTPPILIHSKLLLHLADKPPSLSHLPNVHKSIHKHPHILIFRHPILPNALLSKPQRALEIPS